MALSARREAFRVDAIARGLDHQRTQYVTAYGDYVANSAATFQAGMLVSLNASQEIIRCVGTTAPLGWAKYNKNTSFYGVVIGEYIQLNGVAATNLAHTNLYQAAGGVAAVRVAAALTGAAYTETVNYSCNYTNGTITRVGAGIPDGSYVYVNYQYALTAQQIADDGHNFWNFDDDVTVQGGKITVITGPGAMIYTTMYDTSQTYDINDLLTAGTTAEVLTGMVTIGGAGAAVGKVIQVPTPDDPYLGIYSSF